jgi:hypothetical protein
MIAAPSKQVKVVEAEKQARVVGDDPVQFRFRGEPFRDVNAVPDEEALVPDATEAVIPLRERLDDHGLDIADERVLREMPSGMYASSSVRTFSMPSFAMSWGRTLLRTADGWSTMQKTLFPASRPLLM